MGFIERAEKEEEPVDYSWLMRPIDLRRGEELEF